MLSLEPLILLIDGNNLAHYLYSNLTPGQKMTQADGQRLIEHMESYSRSYPAQIHIELCLDRSPRNVSMPDEALRVCFAEYPQTADDLLLGRFWYHHLGRRRCLVVTNDEAILEEVAETGGTTLRAFDFVRRPGLAAPVFRSPDELPAVSEPLPEDAWPGQTLSLSTSIYFRITKEEVSPEREERSNPPRAKKRPESQRETETGERGETETWRGGEGEPEEKPVALEGDLPSVSASPFPPNAVPSIPVSPVTPSALGVRNSETSIEDGPYYFLSIDTWPIGDGVRFLLNAFCHRHRAAYQDLISILDPADLRRADLRALAELLLHACGDEPGFATRGALMARVRLALLQARGEPLALEALAKRAGLKPSGLRGRIKEKAGKWVEIYE